MGGKQGPCSLNGGEGGLARRHVSGAAGNEGLTGHLRRGGLGGIGEQRPDQRGSTEGRCWGARACSPRGGSLPSRPTPRLTASGTPAQVVVTTSRVHPTPPFPPLSVQCVHSSNHHPPRRKSIKAASISS